MIKNSNAAEVQRLNTRVDELLRERDTFRKALEKILESDAEYRASLPENFDTDPITDACNEARLLLALSRHDRDHVEKIKDGPS